ncbi:hypothetical protein TELCIR_06208 [Teladorsagia circumcincta]|uniref:Uncharacterized protein n=1 Tax=Teladorsagia circumcincta TaxID=45464 RepID=A0A2G9UNQ2_TELCI|nr:hypothetical protein TELCIR_06208 [Teladorsagia circumcincta]
MSLSRTVMHKLQFARGIGQREMIRANTLPSITRAKILEKLKVIWRILKYHVVGLKSIRGDE